MDVSEKPAFLPPRKRGLKPRGEVESNSYYSPQNRAKAAVSSADPRANRNLHIPAVPSECLSDLLNLSCQAPLKPGKRRCEGSSDNNSESGDRKSGSLSSLGSCSGSFVTMVGTVKRGKKKGQTMDMKVQMSREELDELEHSILSHQLENDDDRCCFGFRKGPHVFTLSLIMVPFVLFLSAGYSFYMGTMTWYNILVYFSEKKPVFHKMFVCPVLIISYPFLISTLTIGLGLYAAVIQVSWHYDNWRRELQDWEKGFYGWLCGVLDLEDCAPYEVVILTEVLSPNDQTKQPVADTAL